MSLLSEPTFNLAKAVVWYGYGGADITDEWHWNGDDYANIAKGDIGNKYPYHISLYAHRGRNWKPRSYYFVVTLKIAGMDFPVANEKGFKNRKSAFARMTEVLREFEASDRFATEVWPKVTDPTRRRDYIKRMSDGSFRWVASSYGRDSDILRGNDGWFWSFPLGTGRFYVHCWMFDWRSDTWKETWNQEDISGTCIGSGGISKEELPEGVLNALESEKVA